MNNDGGPAFPQGGVYDGNRGEVNPVGYYFDAGGMTIRDYFMVHAPAAEIDAIVPSTLDGCAAYLGIEPSEYKNINDYFRVLARARCQWADAMLAEREK